MSIANPVPVSPANAVTAIAPASRRPSSVSKDDYAPVLSMVNFLFLNYSEITILRCIKGLTNNGEHLCVLSNDLIQKKLKIKPTTAQRALLSLQDFGLIYITVKDTELGKNSRVIFFDRYRAAELSGSYDFMHLPPSVVERNPSFMDYASAAARNLARADGRDVVQTTAFDSAESSTGSATDNSCSNATSLAGGSSINTAADSRVASHAGNSSTDSVADNVQMRE